jgi:Raf kinase inhibitor-like YbhB/YbcL family protein
LAKIQARSYAELKVDMSVRHHGLLLGLKACITAWLAVAGFSAWAQNFTLSSPDIAPDRPFAEKFLFAGLGCAGGNVSPALNWTAPPEGTKSLALMVHDPDAPTGGAGIWHWVVVNMPASARGLDQGVGTADGTLLPPGSKQVLNDYAGLNGGTPAWGGPCPPKGAKAHTYVFTLYALSVDRIDLPAAATASHHGFIVNRAALAKAVLTAPYGR